MLGPPLPVFFFLTINAAKGLDLFEGGVGIITKKANEETTKSI